MIELVEETPSTNADLLRRLADGEGVVEGHWLRALCQSAGRGRRGREWIAAAGNLSCSTVVNLRASDPPAPTLAFAAALAVHDAIVAHLAPPFSDTVLLKWPNDALIGDAKVCGVLLERVGDHVVAGIGINVATTPDVTGRLTTSLHAAGGQGDAGQVLDCLTSAFTVRLAQWRGQGLSATLADWQRRATPVGTPLQVVVDGEAALSGAFAGLDHDGALRLRLADGSLRVIHAGDVSLL